MTEPVRHDLEAEIRKIIEENIETDGLGDSWCRVCEQLNDNHGPECPIGRLAALSSPARPQQREVQEMQEDTRVEALQRRAEQAEQRLAALTEQIRADLAVAIAETEPP